MILASLLLQDRNDLALEFITKVSRRLSGETGRQLRSANHSSRGLEFVFFLFWRNIVGSFSLGLRVSPSSPTPRFCERVLEFGVS